MSIEDTKLNVLNLVQTGQHLQAFELALATHVNQDIPEYQRENDYKKLVQQLLLVNGGIPWDEVKKANSSLVDDCLNLLSSANDESSTDRKTITACLLKLLSNPRVDWVRSGQWRPKVVDYIKGGIDQDYFQKHRKVDFSEQNHVVVNTLGEAVRSIVKDVKDAINLLTSFARFSSHRNQLLQHIRRPDGVVVFSPFLPTEFIASLNEIYSRVEEYIDQRESPDALDCFERTTRQLKQFISDLEAFNTEYSRLFAHSLGSKILSILQDDFRGNKAAQPAQVKVLPRDKKYPFHSQGVNTRLALSIENVGPGYANEPKLFVVVDKCLKVSVDQETISPGRLSPGERINIDIPVEVISPVTTTTIMCEMTWKDFDRSRKEEHFTFDLSVQVGITDWDALVRRDPYSLEPVETEEDLVGRKDLLNRLIGTFDSRTVGSAIMRGQKRVGKTSIAKTVGHELEKRGFLVIFLEQGDYIDPDPRKTVALLGERLCRKLQRREPRIKHLSVPTFVDALTPLGEFLDDAEEILEDRRIVFILDEFDELPPELYMRGDLGDALFMTLRSLSSRNRIGFLLVGGEKMSHVTNYQGIRLNKWRDEQVDYFSRETEWADYRELIERPVQGSLEYSEAAIERLYLYSAGNPFFTKQICGYVLRAASERRDSYVTDEEIELAIEKAVVDLSTNTFQHFWDDGIIDKEDIYLDKTTRRRKILIATAVTIEQNQLPTLEAIKNHPMLHDVVYVENEIREFVNRRLLAQESGDQTFKFTVQLFYKWLQNKGINELISMFPDPSLSVQGIQAQELLRIKPAEIVALVERWGNYKGQQITTDKVRAWLEQFGGPREQRLMFKLLQGVNFYTQVALRGRMREIHEIVRQGLSRNLGKDRKAAKYSEILISYLDGPDKSGASFARLYADVAEVYVNNVVEKSEILTRIEESDSIQALVFIDDFVGTGKSAVGYIKDLSSRLQPILTKRAVPLRVVFAAVVVHHQGWDFVQQSVESLSLEVKTHACEVLDESHQCFSDSSRVFSDPVDREAAKQLALEFGKKLDKHNPLGYGNLELALVFEDNSPNNTLPILRAESSGQFIWKPLFKRS